MSHHPLANAQYNIAVAQGSVTLVPPNPRRVGLVISSPKLSVVWVSFRVPAQKGVGIPLQPNQSPFYLTAEQIGPGLRDEIYAYAEAGTELMGALDIFG